jgi:pyruvate-formate lyase
MSTQSFTTAKTDYSRRIQILKGHKLEQTAEKQRVLGSMDHDDWAVVLPPEESRIVVDAVSGSGMPIRDCLLKEFKPESNHPSGGFFGPAAVGRNFRRLLELHPVHLDSASALAGAYMVNFGSYRKPGWNPDLDYADFKDGLERYKVVDGIAGGQHFCQDMTIGFELGFGGLLEKIRTYKKKNCGDAGGNTDFYVGLEDIVLGMQNWIERTARKADEMAEAENDQELKCNLEEIAEINYKLVEDPPTNFREACQWTLWFLIAARMFNGSGSLGRIDEVLLTFYQADLDTGILDRDEAVFTLACLLLGDTAYIQVGGTDKNGRDSTNELSFLVLEAARLLKIPANVAVAVGENIDPDLLRRGARILIEDRLGMPKFVGYDSMVEGFAKSGFPRKLGRQRVYSGCHWHAIPGREYGQMDQIKINFAVAFDIALHELVDTRGNDATFDELWDLFNGHLEQAVGFTARAVDHHHDHKQNVCPELVMDLLCTGPIEKGIDASAGGLEFYPIGVDGAGLATVADSFAAIDQRVLQEKRLDWVQLLRHLDNDWKESDGETIRLAMNTIKRYGSGGSAADRYAERITELYNSLVTAHPTPGGLQMVPGLFSWANTIPMGMGLGATPNGRHANAPISHGANPDPDFSGGNAPTALAIAVARTQPGLGNASPMQLDMTYRESPKDEDIENLCNVILTHFKLGGTQINANAIDSETILAAHEHPENYPDLVVRVTGFSAYFSSLSPDFRQMVVDRLLGA